MKIDVRDVITFGGIGAAALGAYLIYPPLALVVGGLMLFSLGMAAWR